MGQVDRLQNVTAGQAVSADQWNIMVELLRSKVFHPAHATRHEGHSMISVPGVPSAFKWVIIRPPVDTGGLSVFAEDAMRNDDYASTGRWIAASEATKGGVPAALTEYPVWPHRTGAHYEEYAWDGVTVLRETQVLLAYYVIDAWYIHPDPPFLMKSRPQSVIKTPCTIV